MYPFTFETAVQEDFTPGAATPLYVFVPKDIAAQLPSAQGRIVRLMGELDGASFLAPLEYKSDKPVIPVSQEMIQQAGLLPGDFVELEFAVVGQTLTSQVAPAVAT